MSGEGFWRRGRRDRELDQEIRAHLDMATRERVERGETAAEARAAALRELGNVGLIKEATRHVWGWTWLERLLQDLRHGWRVLARNRTFSAVAVATLALGIGASTAMFSVVYGVLLRPLPYARPERIVELREVSAEGRPMNVSDPNFADLRAQSGALDGLAEYAAWVASVAGAAEPTRSQIAFVSRDFFAVLQVQPFLGRAFTADDRREGAAPVALVSHDYWRQALGGAAELGRARLTIEGRELAVVGVLPPGFGFPDGAAIWEPRELEKVYPSRTAHNWHVLGRLRDGVTLRQARAEIGGIARRLRRQYGRDTDMADAAVTPLRDAMTAPVSTALWILLGAVGFLLLIAYANVVNLQLAQVAARQGELAVRAALGAGRGRLLHQFLTEALALSLAGGALGVLAAWWAVKALLAAAPSSLPRLAEVEIQLPVLLFALGLTLAVATGLALFATRQAAAGDIRGTLGELGRTQAGTVRGQRTGRWIVAAQLAMTLLLLVGAGLLGRSMLRVLAVEPGFRAERIAAIDLALPPVDGEEGARRRVRFLDDLLARLRPLPGVLEVGGSSGLPLANDPASGTFLQLSPNEKLANFQDFERLSHDAARTGQARFCVASRGYFSALDIPLRRGRLFDDRDTAAAPAAALISESLAAATWPGRDPLGRLIEFGNMDGDLRPLTVVGVVGDVRTKNLETPPSPIVYVDYRQRPRGAESFTIVLRTATDPRAVLTPAAAVVRQLDPTLPPSLTTFTRVLAQSTETRRFNLVLVAAFAGTALLLALLGTYGVTGYAVARRTREVGVRMALGARAGDVVRLILGQALAAIALGAAAGLAAALALTRTMGSLLFGIGAGDPLTLAVATLLLVGVAAFGTYLPARRATRVDPLLALRGD